jgi:hypothetical protein
MKVRKSKNHHIVLAENRKIIPTYTPRGSCLLRSNANEQQGCNIFASDNTFVDSEKSIPVMKLIIQQNMRNFGKLRTTQFDWLTFIFMHAEESPVVQLQLIKQCIWACRARIVQTVFGFRLLVRLKKYDK